MCVSYMSADTSVFAGEIVKITREGIKSMCVVPRPSDQPSALCIFEYVYFARPDSVMEGTNFITHSFMTFLCIIIPVFMCSLKLYYILYPFLRLDSIAVTLILLVKHTRKC